MHAAILQVLTGDSDTDDLPSDLGGGLPAADISRTAYLDGRHIHHGTLAGRVKTTDRVPLVTDETITTEQVTGHEQVLTDVIIDLGGGWAGASTGAGGEVLEGYLSSEAGVIPEPASIDIDAWVERLERRDDAHVWGVSYSQSIEDGHREDRAGAQSHEDVKTHSMPVEGKSSVGFRYRWDGIRVEGMIAASGYVAVYNDWPAETYARFIAEEVVEKLSVEVDAQQALPDDEDTSAEDSPCVECDRQTDTNDDGLCVVCQSRREEEDSEVSV